MADVSQIKLPNGTIYDLIDEKSGYITAQYIENKTDYEIPVSRVGEIVVGETIIGTDSTNFPTSKAVVDYVDERVDQEINAINVGVTSINGKIGSITLSASDVGAASQSYVDNAIDDLWIPTSTSQLTNDSGFITVSEIPAPDLSNYMQKGVDRVTAGQKSGTTLGNYVTAEGFYNIASGNYAHAEGCNTTASGNASHSTGSGTIASGPYSHSEGYETTASGDAASAKGWRTTASGTGSCASGSYVVAAGIDSYAHGYQTQASSRSQYVFGEYNIIDNTGTATTKGTYVEIVGNGITENSRSNARTLDWSGNEVLKGKLTIGTGPTANMDVATKQYVDTSIPTVPTNISAFTNDSGYLTASDIASIMTYKGTKANYAALPPTGNTIGDVWHLTDTGAEWAWDGSVWQELGTAIDLSNYAAKATTLSGYGITDAKIQNGTITLGSNTITPLTSYTETDPVFSASAAAGISSSDISNWNGKSSTDEKVKAIALTFDDIEYYPIFGDSSGIAKTKNYTTAFGIGCSSTYNRIDLKLGTASIAGQITLYRGQDSNRYATIKINTITGGRIITIPDKTGTIALTSDIPSVYSSTNTGGYLTMATLPIYDGTVV